MIVKIIINKETLEVTTEEGVTLNHISDNGTVIELEVSKQEEAIDGNNYIGTIG